MQLSDRINGIIGNGPNDWEVFFRAREMLAAGQDVVELTIGEHDIRTHPTILAAMNKAAEAGHTGYALISGTDALRKAVAERVQERTGIATTMNNVMITTGGQAALSATHAAVCDPGDSAAFIDPYYATYPGTIRAVGANPVAIPTSPDSDFQPSIEDIKNGLNGAKSLLINSPNNPTGVIYSRETLEGIAQVCIDHDLWLISDEVYDTQIWDGEHISPRALPGMLKRTLVIGSMSKSHAMTGSRCGWVVGPEDAIARMGDLGMTTTFGVPGFIQDAAEYALGAGKALEEEVGAPFERRRAIGARLLAAQNVIRLVKSGGAMYLMLDIRATGMSGVEFANTLLDECAVAVMPGESFGQAAAGHVRVAMTVEDSVFETALESIIEFTRKHAK